MGQLKHYHDNQHHEQLVSAAAAGASITPGHMPRDYVHITHASDLRPQHQTQDKDLRQEGLAPAAQKYVQDLANRSPPRDALVAQDLSGRSPERDPLAYEDPSDRGPPRHPFVYEEPSDRSQPSLPQLASPTGTPSPSHQSRPLTPEPHLMGSFTPDRVPEQVIPNEASVKRAVLSPISDPSQYTDAVYQKQDNIIDYRKDLSIHQRPIKDLPLIKRPISFDDIENVPDVMITKVNRAELSSGPLYYKSYRSDFNNDLTVKENKQSSTKHCHIERNSILVSTENSARNSGVFNTKALLRETIINRELFAKKDSTINRTLSVISNDLAGNRNLPVLPVRDNPVRDNPVRDISVRDNPVRVIQPVSSSPVNAPVSNDLQTVSREVSSNRKVLGSAVLRPWTSPERNDRREQLSPIGAQRQRYESQENRRAISNRVVPYHVPSKHYNTEVTRKVIPEGHPAQITRKIIPEGHSSQITRKIIPEGFSYVMPRRDPPNHPYEILKNRENIISNETESYQYRVTSPNYTLMTSPSTEQGHMMTSTPRRVLGDRWENQAHEEMDLHHQRQEASRFRCEDCGKSYATFSGLTKHKQFHCSALFKKEFSCKYCNKTYVSLGALKMHIRTHTLPCKCNICGKAFSRPWLLQGHIRTHTGEKPFSCDHCSRSFADRSNLRAHLQTHTDIKKYNCKNCPKTFSRMSLLIKHEDGGCVNSTI